MTFELSGNAYPKLDHTAPPTGKAVTELEHFELSEEGVDSHMRPTYPVDVGGVLRPRFVANVPIEDRSN